MLTIASQLRSPTHTSDHAQGDTTLHFISPQNLKPAALLQQPLLGRPVAMGSAPVPELDELKPCERSWFSGKTRMHCHLEGLIHSRARPKRGKEPGKVSDFRWTISPGTEQKPTENFGPPQVLKLALLP